MNKIIRLDATPGFAAVQPTKTLINPKVIVKKISINKNSKICPEKIKSPQTRKTAIPKKNETIKQNAYGITRPTKSQGEPFKIICSYCFVIFKRGTIPIVAKVKNIAPKKNKNPCVCAFDVEPEGLNSTRVFKVSPLELEAPEAIALSIATSSGRASFIFAVCAVFELS